MSDIYVLIPTKDRPDHLSRALTSVASQTRVPNAVIVISDSNEVNEETEASYVHEINSRINVELIRNGRTKNLSGALNTGIKKLVEKGATPEKSYLAFLDDDDLWEPEYLDSCFNIADSDKLDLVISGIVRHDSKRVTLSIPEKISPDDFLVKNPHIQGSNLFVKFSTLLMAGGFDESLKSTTDRDVMIRILDIGNINYGCLQKHLVHHMAIDSLERLSTPGSSQKREGLLAFYEKYSPRMSQEQKLGFKQRAQNLFDVDVDLKCESGNVDSKDRTMYAAGRTVPIIIGFMATRLDSTNNLLNDILRINRESPRDAIKRLVILDNTPEEQKLREMINSPDYSSLNIRILSRQELKNDCINGVFGEYYRQKDSTSGISSGRSMLHHYLYIEAKKIPGSAVWILDDDIRLDYLTIDGIVNLSMDEIQAAIIEMKGQGISIANGPISGDPPIPAMSMIRTQLLDLYYHITASNITEETIDRSKQIVRAHPDYYYDYSELHQDHLEKPVWQKISEKGYEEIVIESLRSMYNGKNIYRPLIVEKNQIHELNDRIVPRGGNTFVLNIECLRLFPNISPSLGNINARRGDTFWCILNSRISGYIVSRSPVAVRQERTEQNVDALNFNSLISDFYGSSFIKAMDNFYVEKIKQSGRLPRRVRLTLNEEDASIIMQDFRKVLDRRLTEFILNSYRVRGLIASIRSAIDNPNLGNHSCTDTILTELEQKFSLDNMENFVKTARAFSDDQLKDFLLNMADYVKSYRHNLSNIKGEEQVEYARMAITRITHKDPNDKYNLRYLGRGLEGVVFTDGTHVYKYFYSGKASFQEGQLEFIKDHILGNRELKRFTLLTDIIEDDGDLVFVIDNEELTRYNGGRLKDFIELLRECKTEGVALSNIHPENVMLGKNGLKFVDIGNSIFPINEKEYGSMCKRAYLTYRWHFRNDISALMEKSLYTNDMPELYGFEYFKEALLIKTKSEILNQKVIDLIPDEHTSILDYGCGRGSITEPLALMGHDIVGYDIDNKILAKNVLEKYMAKYVNIEGLEGIKKSGKKFDIVLCSLVLCTIVNDNDLEGIITDMRSLISDAGELIVALCNPFYTFTGESESHVKMNLPDESKYRDHFIYHKQMKEKGRIRVEAHRPFSYYKDAFMRGGFEIRDIIEVGTTDVINLAPSKDFMIVRLKPLKQSSSPKVSLMIKTCSMEFQTIDMQVRHIIRQLEGPQRFIEKIVLVDDQNSYIRQYCTSDMETLMAKLEAMLKDGVIDKIIVIPKDPEVISKTYDRWFGVKCDKSHTMDGQPTFMMLYGLDNCKGDYVLQLDADCLIARIDREHDYLGDMVDVFENDPKTLTVSFNIAHEKDEKYTNFGLNGKWRTEVRFSMFNMSRLRTILSLPNECKNGYLKLSWYRSMDLYLKDSEWQSYRGGDRRTFFIHVPNHLKIDINLWYNIMIAVENGEVPFLQYDNVDLNGLYTDWLKPRNEQFIFIVRGRNVSISKLRRCIDSLHRQISRDWAVVIIDAASDNGMQEYIRNVLCHEFKGRATALYNFIPITSMENNKIAISQICGNPESVVITLDADDALIVDDVINVLLKYYNDGADLTVGSMLRTDKHKDYPVDFDDPRNKRGGNVWQHLRTFKKYLFDTIPEDYLKLDGQWIDYAEDWVFMVPMVEISKNPKHVREILYFYEPTGKKDTDVRQKRESLISRIIEKKTLRRQN